MRPDRCAPSAGTGWFSWARRQPVFERARAAIAYDDASRRLILVFKHGDLTDAAPAFARWLARAGGELLGEAECLVPVPLHWSRLFARRYNQAALLAGHLGKLSGVPMVPDALVRQRRTPPQGRMGMAARAQTLASALAVAQWPGPGRASGPLRANPNCHIMEDAVGGRCFGRG